MADRTSSGKPVDEKSKYLKMRKLELQVLVMKTDIERHEVSILEHEAEIERTRDTIRGLQDSIAVTEEQITTVKLDVASIA